MLKGEWGGATGPVTFVGMTYEVMPDIDTPMDWKHVHSHTRRQGLEITANGQTWYIDNQHGDGYYKLTLGMGSPRCGHKSIGNPHDIKYIPDEEIIKVYDERGLSNERRQHARYGKRRDLATYRKLISLVSIATGTENKFSIGDVLKVIKPLPDASIGVTAVVFEDYGYGISVITQDGHDLGGFNPREQNKYFKQHSKVDLGYTEYNYCSDEQLAHEFKDGAFKDAFTTTI